MGIIDFFQKGGREEEKEREGGRRREIDRARARAHARVREIDSARVRAIVRVGGRHDSEQFRSALLIFE